MKLTHSEKAVLLEALEGYGFEIHIERWFDEDGEEYENHKSVKKEQTITDVGKLADRQKLINRIQKIESEAPAI